MSQAHQGASYKDISFEGAHEFAPEILRAYDIRGVVGKTITPRDAYYVGRAFGTFVKRQNETKEKITVCIGYDGRISSPELAHAVSSGLQHAGVHVVNLGLGPTPMVYFGVKDMITDGGIMITGSHNPPSHNGFKMTLQKKPVFGESVQEIGRIAASADFTDGQGQYQEKNIIDRYVERLVSDLTTSKELKIAWDAGNGAAGAVLQTLTDNLPGEHILIYDNVDGTFPAHHPDPTVDKNLEDLQHVVRTQKCNFGIAFDGDGDRIGVVDENGGIIRSDMLIALYAREILEKQPGAPIIADVKCSKTLFDEIKKAGGEPVICATGHSIVKNKLNELSSPLAGELSGHIFFADKYYGYDDALYCGVRLMNIMDDVEGGLSDLMKDIPKVVNTPEIRFEVDESQKFNLIDQSIDHFKEMARKRNGEWDVVDVDGIRVNTPKGWFLMRASNTQNALSMRVEAISEHDLQELLGYVRGALDKLGLDTQSILADIG